MSRQMYQFTANPNIQDNDILPWSNENSITPPHVASKLTFAQFKARLSATLVAPTQQIEVRQTGGVDAPGNGTPIAPYATISYALSQITDNSPSKRYLINSIGDVSIVGDYYFRPNISYDFNGYAFNISGHAYLDSSWLGMDGVIQINNMYNSNWVNTAFLDFDDIGSGQSILLMSNCQFNTTAQIYINGNQTNGTTVVINELYGLSDIPDLQIKSCYGSVFNSVVRNYEHHFTSVAQGNNFRLIGLEALETANVFHQITANSNLICEGCSLNVAYFSALNSGILSVRSFAHDYPSSLVLDNGVSGGSVDFNGDPLRILPTLLNGAVYSPTIISDTILANIIATNYTPTNSSVAGNLVGIDVALGLLQSMFSAGQFTPGVYGVSNVSAITLSSARFTQIGNLVDISIGVMVTVTSSIFGFSFGMVPGFTLGTSSITPSGGWLTTSTPNAADGNLVAIAPDTITNRVQVTANATVGSGVKFVYLSCKVSV